MGTEDVFVSPLQWTVYGGTTQSGGLHALGCGTERKDFKTQHHKVPFRCIGREPRNVLLQPFFHLGIWAGIILHHDRCRPFGVDDPFPTSSMAQEVCNRLHAWKGLLVRDIQPVLNSISDAWSDVDVLQPQASMTAVDGIHTLHGDHTQQCVAHALHECFHASLRIREIDDEDRQHWNAAFPFYCLICVQSVE